MTLGEAKRILMVGVGGSGMSGLAYLLAAKGKEVQGVDQDTAIPQIAGVTILPTEQAEEAVSHTDIVIHSDAVPATHPLLVQAVAASVAVYSYQKALGEFAADYMVLAVTGAHGKSSTTAFLAHILTEAGLDPTALIGAPVVAWDRRGARAGKSSYMVVEADEYREHFLSLRPTVLVITTIDYDHPDFFSSLEQVQELYKKFMGQVAPDGSVIVLESEYKKQPESFWPTNIIRVPDEEAASYTAPLPGEHMKTNMALAVAAAMQVGIAKEKAVAALSSFAGLGRRFEKIGEMQGKPIISDYGHHPAEIAATLRGAKETFADKKILVLFEAHMIERLTTFFPEFAQALALADGVIACPVFYPKGREGEKTDILPKLQAELQKKEVPCHTLPSWESLQETLAQELPAYDMAIAFTAGVLDGKLRQIL